MDKEQRIVKRLNQHLLVAWMGINQSDRSAARRNFRKLVRKYPDIAQAYDFHETEVSAVARCSLRGE